MYDDVLHWLLQFYIYQYLTNIFAAELISILNVWLYRITCRYLPGAQDQEYCLSKLRHTAHHIIKCWNFNFVSLFLFPLRTRLTWTRSFPLCMASWSSLTTLILKDNPNMRILNISKSPWLWVWWLWVSWYDRVRPIRRRHHRPKGQLEPAQ